MNSLYWIELFGVAVFAIAGTLEASRKRFDLFGVLVLAFVTALGGGTLRDLLLNVSPLAWIADLTLAYTALIAATLAFILVKFVAIPFKALLYADAIGLAAFTVSGTQASFDLGLPGLVVVMMGMASGIAGGIFRDLLANEVPLIFRRDVYATAALIGSLVSYLLFLFGVAEFICVITGFAIIVAIRFAAIRWQLSLPRFLFTTSYRQPSDKENS
ncbi:trimeric intracellular cation channel family protein [Reinekea thalattae]|uniref:Trimeric intracellular cation channel family protein n=1 Tax=Reinekea thalattae TaxID=2593301 RepID=A0A5C8Z8M1_9GAMM|nr:trimeric intracellular cation channel family protein [Reinekea thalattae]TXR54027.1 trimeric intracellular cation channel family protein [Reinekea thalattae]